MYSCGKVYIHVCIYLLAFEGILEAGGSLSSQVIRSS